MTYEGFLNSLRDITPGVHIHSLRPGMLQTEDGRALVGATFYEECRDVVYLLEPGREPIVLFTAEDTAAECVFDYCFGEHNTATIELVTERNGIKIASVPLF